MNWRHWNRNKITNFTVVKLDKVNREGKVLVCNTRCNAGWFFYNMHREKKVGKPFTEISERIAHGHCRKVRGNGEVGKHRVIMDYYNLFLFSNILSLFWKKLPSSVQTSLL